MKIAAISFTRAGARLSVQLKERMERPGENSADSLELFTKYSGSLDPDDKINFPQEGLGAWTGKHFTTGEALLFIGACGIAVRSIAPFIRSKTTDPAVLVMDEKGEFVIPILSGHLGEANRIAGKIETLTGARAVLTTATDVNHVFAVDVFAGRNGLYLSDMKKAKEVSAALLEGEKITLYYDPRQLELEGEIPEGIAVSCLPDRQAEDWKAPDRQAAGRQMLNRQAAAHGVYLTCRERTEAALCLIPRQLYLGIGCRKGKSCAELRAFVTQTLGKYRLDRKALAGIYSIDLKKEEAGIRELARELGLDFHTFPAETLRAAEGEFHGSDFVKARTGVDNVCERAVMAAGAERILVPKTARDGMTLSIGIRKGKVRFE